ncbi:MAG: DUF2027 domain-containing protein [Prevotellaceae bacterium]|jgi:hypothetical protein|nr:DUF2027 domain-containing protein [Prevotellaceae bacterium]
MQCKVGDTVRFLNEVGGGVISHIINAKMVNVQDEDGFEIPMLISDIVVVTPAETKTLKPVVLAKQNNITEKTGAEEKIASQQAYNSIVENSEGSDFEVLLAFVPVNEKNIQNSDLELFLINDSPYNMLYTIGIWTVKGKIKLLSKNDLEPDSKEFVSLFRRTDLNTVQTLNVTFLLYKQTRDYELQVPEQINIELNPLKFVKQGSFEENDFFDEKAVIYKVATSKVILQEIDINVKQLEAAMKQKKDVKQPSVVGAKKNPEIEEIDIHIENLVDNAKDLDNAQILEIQKARFITALDLGIMAGTRRMVFIHGVGNGKLKYEIRRLLDTQYAGKIRYQDASFKEYGYGATMVIIG